MSSKPKDDHDQEDGRDRVQEMAQEQYDKRVWGETEVGGRVVPPTPGATYLTDEELEALRAESPDE